MAPSPVKAVPSIITIVTSLIILFFLYRAYTYLGSLDKCECISKVYPQNLLHAELFIITLSVIGIASSIVSNFYGKNIIVLPPALMGLFALIILCVYIYFIYNAFEFSKTVKESCDCSNKWQKDIIYIQAIYYSIPIILIFALLLFSSQLFLLVFLLFSIGVLVYYENKKYNIFSSLSTDPSSLSQN